MAYPRSIGLNHIDHMEIAPIRQRPTMQRSIARRGKGDSIFLKFNLKRAEASRMALSYRPDTASADVESVEGTSSSIVSAKGLVRQGLGPGAAAAAAASATAQLQDRPSLLPPAQDAPPTSSNSPPLSASSPSSLRESCLFFAYGSSLHRETLWAHRVKVQSRVPATVQEPNVHLVFRHRGGKIPSPFSFRWPRKFSCPHRRRHATPGHQRRPCPALFPPGRCSWCALQVRDRGDRSTKRVYVAGALIAAWRAGS